jgi:hypothetical protein
MPIRFEEIRQNDGFDGSATPNPWLMVPLSGVKEVRLAGVPMGTTVSLTSSNENIARIAYMGAGGLVRIEGVHPGPASIEVRVVSTAPRHRGLLADINAAVNAPPPSGPPAVTLDLAVKSPKTVKTTFNFVQDKNGVHKTTRSKSSVDGWISDINKIHTPQNNVTFTKQNVRDVTINQDLGSVVRWAKGLPGVPASEHEWDVVVAQGDSTADFNIFFVWEYEQDDTPDVDNTDAGTLGGNCIFEDNAGSRVGETLAHEAGHFLGAPDTNLATEKNFLMYGITDQRGQKIPKVHAVLMNP